MTQKHLSYSAILVLAANTMNGPGITTLPDVAVSAGLFLYLFLIAISVNMAAFVCHRMVYAMWSSLKGDAYFLGRDDGSYERVESVESEIKSILEEDEAMEETIPKKGENIQLTGLHHGQLEHREGHGDKLKTDLQQQVMVEPNDSVAIEMQSELLLESHDLPHAQPAIEHTSIVGQSLEGYGRFTSTFVALTMVASALCLALAQMMLCAAIMDGLFVVIGGKSCALGLPSENEEGESSWVYCTTHSSMKPYMNSGAPVSIMSIGWLVATAVSVFLGTKHLDEMMGVQYTFFGCLLISCARFTYVLRSMAGNLEIEQNEIKSYGALAGEVDNTANSPVSWGIGPNPFEAIGPIMFNFAFVVTAPPLSALAKRQSIASNALGMSCVVMGGLYTVVGWVGAPVSKAVRNGLISGGDDTNLLSLILLSGGDKGVSTLDLVFIAAFGISILASVPVYCLLAQQTLVHDAGVSKLPAFILSNVVPWILVALTYNAAFFEAFVNWSGLLILGYANFSLPLLLDTRLQKVRIARARSSNYVNGQSDSPSKERRPGSIGVGQTAKVTNIVFSLVTASISSVIAISLMPVQSLSVTGIVFVAMIFATTWWPDASMNL